MSELTEILKGRFEESECNDIECYAAIVSDTITEMNDASGNPMKKMGRFRKAVNKIVPKKTGMMNF